MSLEHPILLKSFAHIDQCIGCHHQLTPQAYEVARRVIHSTADFDFLNLLRFEPNPSSSDHFPSVIDIAINALGQSTPIVADVSMVRQGIQTLVNKTFQSPLYTAIDYADPQKPGKTRTESGIIRCIELFPQAIYIIGNAPTALLALCQAIAKGKANPAFVIGAPVGFIDVLEAKSALSSLNCPQIRVEGNKGGSPVAAAILNALLTLTYRIKHS
ncbi:MAG: cobalt-precorrin-8X methylmutase [Synechocystis sp.]|jgi:precorrin-8X/cobalt-precorrin-8 methylmutase